MVKNFLSWIRKDCNIKKLVKNGLTVGKNCSFARSCIIDESHTWLIEIGNNVTITERCIILSHDASMHNALGYTKLGRVKIGNGVFIGVNSVILPNTIIGDNTIIGAGSVVSGKIEPNSVYTGVPAKKIANIEDFFKKHEQYMKKNSCFDESYTLREKITENKKNEMKKKTEKSGICYVK